MMTEQKWTAGNQFAEILLLRRSTSLSGSEKVVIEPEGKGERTTRRRDGGGRVRHEQKEQGKCKRTRSKEKLGEKGKRASQISGIKICLVTLSTPLICKTKKNSLRPLVWIRLPQFQAHPNHSISHQPVPKDI